MLAQSIGFLALVGSALSAQTPPTVQDVAAQSNALASSLVVPDYIPIFNPTGVLSVVYNTSTGPVSIGGAQQLSPVRVGSTPAIAFNPLAGSATSPLYMLVMVDMDIPTSIKPGVLHWAQSDLTLNPDTGALTSNVKPVAQYAGPAPPQGNGTHRYVQLLYPQPTSFRLSAKYQNLPTTNGGARFQFSLSDFLTSGGFGAPIGGNFFKSTYDGTTGINTVVVTATGVPAGNTAGQTAPGSSGAASATGSTRPTATAASVAGSTGTSGTSAPAATATRTAGAISNSFKGWTFGAGFALAIAELVML